MSYQTAISATTQRVETLVVLKTEDGWQRYARQFLSIRSLQSAFPAYANTAPTSFPNEFLGVYEGRLLEASPIERKFSTASPSETAFDLSQKVNLRLADTDGKIGALALKGAEVWVLLKPKDDDALLLFNGQVRSQRRRRQAMELECVSYLDEALESLENIAFATGDRFPYALPEDQGRMFPLLYGALDSLGQQGAGMVKLFPLDGGDPRPYRQRLRYALASHQVQSVTRVMRSLAEGGALDVTSRTALQWDPTLPGTTLDFLTTPPEPGTLDGTWFANGDEWEVSDSALPIGGRDFSDASANADATVGSGSADLLWVELPDGEWKAYVVHEVVDASAIVVANPDGDPIAGRPYILGPDHLNAPDIVVDVYGKVDTEGRLIENPVDVLADIIALHTSFPQDFSLNRSDPHFPFKNTGGGVRQKLFALGMKAAGVVDEPTAPAEVIEALCFNFNLRLYQTQRAVLPAIALRDSMLEVELLNIATEKAALAMETNPQALDWRLRESQDVLAGSFKEESEGEKLVNRLDYRWAKDHSGRLDEDFYRRAGQDNRESQDLLDAIYTSSTLEYEWIQDGATAFLAASILLWRFSRSQEWIHFENSLSPTFREVGSLGAMTRRDWSEARALYLESIETDPEGSLTALSFLDYGRLHADCHILGDETALAGTWGSASSEDRRFGYLADESNGTFVDGANIKRLCP